MHPDNCERSTVNESMDDYSAHTIAPWVGTDQTPSTVIPRSQSEGDSLKTALAHPLDLALLSHALTVHVRPK